MFIQKRKSHNQHGTLIFELQLCQWKCKRINLRWEPLAAVSQLILEWLPREELNTMFVHFELCNHRGWVRWTISFPLSWYARKSAENFQGLGFLYLINLPKQLWTRHCCSCGAGKRTAVNLSCSQRCPEMAMIWPFTTPALDQRDIAEDLTVVCGFIFTIKYLRHRITTFLWLF